MISLEDCIALCGLTEQEVMAIAEHEHVPEIAAAAIRVCEGWGWKHPHLLGQKSSGSSQERK